MKHLHSKNAVLVNIVIALYLGLFIAPLARAQLFHYTAAVPERSPSGTPMPGANTTFADGSVFQPAADTARSSKWTWRAQGEKFVLSSLGPGSTTPPGETKELVTTVTGLKPGGKYAARVLFWSPDPGVWGVRAGLGYANGLRTNPWFTNGSAGVTVASLLPWETIPSVFEDDGGRPLYAASVGTGTANSNGELKIFVHDLPTGDSAQRTWYQGVAICEVTDSAIHTVNAAAAGSPFNRGVRGLAIADITIDRGEYYVGIPTSLEVACGSTIRGVATGLAADIYDWRTRNGQPRPPTLQFLRYSRDYSAELFMGVNVRGLICPDPAGGWQYYDTNTSTLVTMAADWVRYVNQIVPAYRQGDTVTDPRDAAILNSLTWSSTIAGDAWDKLQKPGEQAVPLIKYWEIGNEPTIGVGAYSVNNTFTVKSNDYHMRYKAIAQAIKAEDPSVKVGPTLVHAAREEDHLAILVSDSSVPIDFITYHPYERMGRLDDPAQITLHLGSVYARQKQFLTDIKRVVAQNGRNPDDIEYAATEVNVSSWDTNDTDKEARIAHALGTVETVFAHARLGLVASLYWIWPTHRWDGTRYPVFKAYEKMCDHLGDTLVSTYAWRDTRVYTTRDSRTGKLTIWGLNFSNDQDATLQLGLQNLPRVSRATLLRLQAKSGATTLHSANLSSEMAGGPAINVDWTASDLSCQNLENYPLSLPAATLTLLVIEPGLDRLTPGFIEQDGQKRFAVTLRPVARASAARYRLLRSENLSDWNVVKEVSSGSAESICLSDDLPASTFQRRFFRVELLCE